jgi:hypothetical protein
MIGLDRIAGFDWNDGNSRKNADVTSVRPKRKASSSTIR